MEEQDHSKYNNQQIGLFLTRDPGWQAWLDAILMSQRANDALVDASRVNTPVGEIIEAISDAQGAYRSATSFNLPPFTVTSSCRDRYSETNGWTQLSDGLKARYSFLTTDVAHFDNGSSCVVSVGIVDEIDSSRGLPIATADPQQPINFEKSFSRYLVWRQPYWTISTGTTLSVPDLVDQIER